MKISKHPTYARVVDMRDGTFMVDDRIQRQVLPVRYCCRIEAHRVAAGYQQLYEHRANEGFVVVPKIDEVV